MNALNFDGCESVELPGYIQGEIEYVFTIARQLSPEEIENIFKEGS